MSALNAASLSLFVGIIVLLLKWLAYWWTGSVALYSDALESFINVAAALVAFIALRVSYQPADDNHPYGHTKAEYFSAVVEGVLVVLAALAIILAAWERLLTPIALTSVSSGILISLLASLCNAALASYLLYISKRANSIALKADGLHVLSDVITSVGVLVGIGLAWLTHWWMLDPLLAILVAINILWMGWQLVRESVGGLMDEGLTPEKRAPLYEIIRNQMGTALQAHAIKTRRAGQLTFIEFHLVVPDNMTVKEAHNICDRLEEALCQQIPEAKVMIHVEPENKSEYWGVILYQK
ncbi:MAG: cation transporter [Thioploca sp.]|nr:cation transporter [Thioploca sp.]